MTPSTVQHIVFDVCDPQLVAAFWSQALERPVEDDWGDFVRLSPDTAGTRIVFAGVPEPRVGKNRLHIDLNTENRERTVAELAGATQARPYLLLLVIFVIYRSVCFIV